MDADAAEGVGRGGLVVALGDTLVGAGEPEANRASSALRARALAHQLLNHSREEDSPSALRLGSRTTRSRQHGVSTALRLFPPLNDLEPHSEGKHPVGDEGDVRSHRGREPVLERKRLGTVSSKVAILG